MPLVLELPENGLGRGIVDLQHSGGPVDTMIFLNNKLNQFPTELNNRRLT